MRGIQILAVLALVVDSAAAQETHQATGVKVGEVTQNSAIVWMRVTAQPVRRMDGVELPARPPKLLADGLKVEDLQFACPGATGQVRLRYGLNQDLAGAEATAWMPVTAKTDFTHQFQLTNLKPATVYFYAAETAAPGGSPKHKPLRGQFETAPPADLFTDVTFTVITGMMYHRRDHSDGFQIYPSMAKLNPKFLVLTGDTVYYDGESPLANTIATARHHWHRTYSSPLLIDFHLRVPGYWEKDDHDTYFNDCWPTMKRDKILPFTFEEGQAIFLEQVPIGAKTYRTFRWGKGLQIWLVEGRDFRSSNRMEDGPEKTIWGEAQKRWFRQSISKSNAAWKVFISPTPMVGPDRKKKADNHSNAAFAHEGNEFRRWVQAYNKSQGNLILVCGDRHWQYHSVDPATGVQEFSSGCTTDRHATGSPGHDPEYHRFHRMRGGFLSVAVSRSGDESVITFRFHNVHGQVLYEHEEKQPAS